MIITTTIPGESDGDEAQSNGKEVQEEIGGWKKEEEKVASERI